MMRSAHRHDRQKTKGSSGKSKETQNAGYYAAPKVMMSDDDSEDEVEDEVKGGTARCRLI